MVSSPDVVEPWEAILTFLFFPLLTALAYAADKGYLDTCAAKVAPESRVTAIGGLHFHAYDFRALMAQLRHPSTTHEERQAIVAKLSTTTKKAKPSRAVQRMNATRSAIGKKAIQQNAPDPAALEKYLARSRRPVVWSHAINSCPSHFPESGFFFEEEAVRTEASDRCSAQVLARSGCGRR